MTDDALDGYRGSDVLLASRLAKMPPDRMLYQRMHLGDIALRVMQGIASHNEAVEVVAAMIASCEVEVSKNTKQLVQLESLDCDEARLLHFEARVAASILTRFNKMIRDGIVAGQQLNNQSE